MSPPEAALELRSPSLCGELHHFLYPKPSLLCLIFFLPAPAVDYGLQIYVDALRA